MKRCYFHQAAMSLHRVFYVTVLLFFCQYSPRIFAQTNLVPNHSFETYTLLPKAETDSSNNPLGAKWIVRLKHTDPDHLPNWFRANQATPDYYHVNPSYLTLDTYVPATGGVAIPQNWGQDVNLYASTDSAYAGIAIGRRPAKTGVTPGADDWHEFLAVHLDSSLERNKQYVIKFKYAIPEYQRMGNKSNFKIPKYTYYYLKNLGIAFAPDTTFLDYDHNHKWYTESQNAYYDATLRTFPLSTDNYVVKDNVQYVYPGTWGEFEAYFQCPANDSTLQYLIIGNFQYRIPFDDIIEVPDAKGDYYAKAETEDFPFYYFIDDVSVQQLAPPNCNCTSIYTCPHSRDEELEEEHENTCCFTTPIIPDSNRSCHFTSVRITIDGNVVSNPPIVSYNDSISFPNRLDVSFCIPKYDDETQVRIKYEFLDADSNIICFKEENVQCFCKCEYAGLPILAPNGTRLRMLIAPTLTKLDTGIAKCCWEYSLKNNWGCSFLGKYGLEFDLPAGTTITPISPWIGSHIGSKYFFSSPTGLKYNVGASHDNTTKVFTICTDPQLGDTTPPKISPVFRDTTNEFICKHCPPITLDCIDSCCPQFDIDLESWGYSTGGECKFNVIVHQKNALTKCDAYGIRIKSSTGTILHTTTTGAILNLDSPTQIWSSQLSNNCESNVLYEPGTPIPSSCDTFTIEILGPNLPNGSPSIKCSVEKEFCCCWRLYPDLSKKSLESKPVELHSGGMITDTRIIGNILQYTIKNNGEIIDASVQFSDLKGNIITRKQINLTKENNEGELDIPKLPSGSYFLNVQTDLWQTSRQIVIIK